MQEFEKHHDGIYVGTGRSNPHVRCRQVQDSGLNMIERSRKIRILGQFRCRSFRRKDDFLNCNAFVLFQLHLVVSLVEYEHRLATSRTDIKPQVSKKTSITSENQWLLRFWRVCLYRRFWQWSWFLNGSLMAVLPSTYFCHLLCRKTSLLPSTATSRRPG